MIPLQLTLSFEPGGRREAIATLARGLAAQGVGCDLACLEQLGCDHSVVEDSFGLAQSLQRDRDGTGTAVRRLVELCDQRRIDLIHTHDAASQWVASRAVAQRPQIKLLMTFHRSLGFESAGWKAKLRNAVAGRSCAAIVVGSRERRRHYTSENFVRADKVVRIPFGVDLNRFHPDAEARRHVRAEFGVGDQEMLVGAVGHFGDEKGIDVASRGFRSFLQSGKERRTRLIVVGRGSAEQEVRMRQLVAGEDRILFAGFRRDVERCFAAMDVFLHVPRLEAFGLVVAEAMACGVPVVASAVGGVPDMVREGETGRLVPSESPEAVASVLAEIYDDPNQRIRLGRDALRVAQAEYPLSLYVSRHLELYRDILDGRPPRGVDESLGANETGCDNGIL